MPSATTTSSPPSQWSTLAAAGEPKPSQLAAYEGLPWDRLSSMLAARSILGLEERLPAGDDVAALKVAAAWELWIDNGVRSMQADHFGELHRVQLVFECLRRGIQAGVNCRWGMMVLLRWELSRERAEAGQPSVPPRLSRRDADDDGFGPNSSDESDTDDERPPPGTGKGYVRSWNAKLGRCVTYAM
ncbi:hypothetical protein BDV95DRAFT_606530 [Massariosphaeria phaeospora]|uniref:Uncharacterized protein n=1 Tax=Massariosphaeria phaeospora TaxID=100035 RepID=A0A7C8M938_9PLEO|nr:hypothetical protein BDV95DRAFT_606530 [Massariosphaeria phaeospora]